MADHLFENQTITSEGLNLVAHATAADAIVYTKALSNATVPADPSNVSSYSGKVGTIASASSSGSAARITLAFENSDTMSSQAVKCVALMGRLQSESGDGIIVAYCSDGESSITLPSSLDAPCVTRFVVNLVMSACSGSTINVVESGVASQSDLSRFVSTHKVGSQLGEDQSVKGTKTFMSGIQSTALSISDTYGRSSQSQDQIKQKKIVMNPVDTMMSANILVSPEGFGTTFSYTENNDRIDFIEQEEGEMFPAQKRSICLTNSSEQREGKIYHGIQLRSAMDSAFSDTSYKTYSTVGCGTMHRLRSHPCDVGTIYHDYNGYFELSAKHSEHFSSDDSYDVCVKGSANSPFSSLDATVNNGDIYVKATSSYYSYGNVTIESTCTNYDGYVKLKAVIDNASNEFRESSIQLKPSEVITTTNVFQIFCNDTYSENRAASLTLQPGSFQLGLSEGVNDTKKSAWLNFNFQGGATNSERVMSVEPSGDEGISWQLGYPGSPRSEGCKFASIACKTMYCDDLQIDQTPWTLKLLHFITGSPTESQVRHDPEVGAICLCRVNNFNDSLHPGKLISGNYLTYVALNDTGNGITNTSVDSTHLEGTWVLLTYSQGSGSLVLVVRIS